jgi:hypothetical protein
MTSNTTTATKAAQASAAWMKKMKAQGYKGDEPMTEKREAARNELLQDHFDRLPHYVLD